MTDFERLLHALSDAGVAYVVVGGVAATLHGSARLTSDLDVVYDRSADNAHRIVEALSPLHPYLRGAPPGLPFRFDEATIRAGLNFTLMTDAGAIDLLGEIAGAGGYPAISRNALEVALFGRVCRCIDLDTLIQAKRAAGRPKDLEVIAELVTIRDELRK